ncbi:MAG: ABC transporter permease [Chloroflexota bacterium]|nr:ABC transporter permease [Chloroflexota bacterium]
MGTASVLLQSEPQVRRRSASSTAHDFLRTLGQNPLNLAGALMTLALVVGAAVGPTFLSDPFATLPAERFQPPSWGHWLGTDNLGRDQLARIAFGLRLTILVSVGAVALGLCVGVPLGLVAGYYGGAVDNLIMRVLDVFFAFPGLLLALAMIAALGSSILNLVLTMGVLFAPSMARVTRGPVLSIRQKEFVEAARALGVRESVIVRTHILPNVLAPAIVASTLQLSAAILIEASLGFLGLGINPPNPSLGGLISQSRTFMGQGPWMAIFPGLAITLLVTGFNLVGDGLRDAVDPRLRDVLDSRTAIR